MAVALAKPYAHFSMPNNMHLAPQVTLPTPHHLIFTGQLLFLTPKQECQSTECNNLVVQ